MQPTELITSRRNPRVIAAVKLRRRRERERQGRFMIDGAREILRASEAGVEFIEAFVCEPLSSGDEARRAAKRLEASPGHLWSVAPQVFEKLSFGDRTDGLVVIARTPTPALADVELPARPLVAVLERLEKPGNVGAVLRSADGAGVDAVIVADAVSDLFNPNTIRASLGTVFDANVVTAPGQAALDWLGERDIPIVTARPDAELSYSEFDYRGGAAIVLGSEAQGLSDRWRGEGVTAVRLPMRGVADSLNVSATAAVLFYEAQRQRGARALS